jgi:hypothetical protein
MYNKNLIITFIISFFIYQIQPVQAMEGDNASGKGERGDNRKRTRIEEEEEEKETEGRDSKKRTRREEEEKEGRHREEREGRHREEREGRHREEREGRHREEREGRHREEREGRHREEREGRHREEREGRHREEREGRHREEREGRHREEREGRHRGEGEREGRHREEREGRHRGEGEREGRHREEREGRHREERERRHHRHTRPLTDIALEEETRFGSYSSPEGLIYQKRRKIKKRIPHITHHLSDDQSRARHTFFDPGTEAYNDIICFIDIVYAQFKRSVNLNNKVLAQNTDVGTITLHGKQYKVLDSYDGTQHRYNIVPAIADDTSYPPLGTRGGYEGDGAKLYGYKLTLFISGNSVEVESFHLSEL